MDTGEYMQNQIDDLIKNGIQIQEEKFEELYFEIQSYIEDLGFTFDADYVIEKFKAKRSGQYVSWSVNQVIKKFYDSINHIL